MSDANQTPQATATVTPIGQKAAAAKPIAAQPATKTLPPKTAGLRLDDLERALMSLLQNHDRISRDANTVREAIKLLGNKVDALAKANIGGLSPTDETLSQIMIDTNVTELKGKVD